jgi:hypothetical protein
VYITGIFIGVKSSVNFIGFGTRLKALNISSEYLFRFCHREAYDKPDVVVGGSPAASNIAALCAAVGDYIAFPGIRLGFHRLHQSATSAGPVARVDVDMKRPKAVWAVVPRGVAEGSNGAPAAGAGKTAVVF